MTPVTPRTAAIVPLRTRRAMNDNRRAGPGHGIDPEVSRMVDSHMSAESVRLKSLQVQQQLAIQSLSMANSRTRSVLDLFR